MNNIIDNCVGVSPSIMNYYRANMEVAIIGDNDNSSDAEIGWWWCKKMSSLMANAKFTKQERVLLIAALTNEQERYEIIARWLFSRIPGYYDDIYLPKSIEQKLILLDREDEHRHGKVWGSLVYNKLDPIAKK
jgi:hypothetical protein